MGRMCRLVPLIVGSWRCFLGGGRQGHFLVQGEARGLLMVGEWRMLETASTEKRKIDCLEKHRWTAWPCCWLDQDWCHGFVAAPICLLGWFFPIVLTQAGEAPSDYPCFIGSPWTSKLRQLCLLMYSWDESRGLMYSWDESLMDPPLNSLRLFLLRSSVYVSFQLHYLNVISGTGAAGRHHLTSLDPRKPWVVLKVTCLRGEWEWSPNRAHPYHKSE